MMSLNSGLRWLACGSCIILATVVGSPGHAEMADRITDFDGEGAVAVANEVIRTVDESNLDDLADDTTPQLGGDLDGQGSYDITGVVEIAGVEKSADPTEPAEGKYVVWQSNGTSSQTGVADGDVCIASQAGGNTKVTILHDHSGGNAWQ